MRIVKNAKVVMYRSFCCNTLGASLAVIFIGLFSSSLAKANSSVSLNWNPDPDAVVAGYNVYYGGGSRSYTNKIDVGNSTNSVVGGLLEGGTYYFAVTAYTLDGDESDYSDELVYLVPGLLTIAPGTTPDSPTQIRFPVASGHSYELQVSSDLISWSTVWEISGTSNVWVEYDDPSKSLKAQYYRVVLH
jgi:hypothetical protein